MAKVKAPSSSSKTPAMRPAITPEGRESQLVSLAYDLAEQHMREGTASSQEITHFLKLGSSIERLKMKNLEEENKLLRAKTSALESQKEYGKLVQDALKAFRSYSGQGDSDEY